MAHELTGRAFSPREQPQASQLYRPRAWPTGVVGPTEVPQRKSYAILSVGRLRFQASFTESLELALKYGFEGLDPDPNYFAALGEDGVKRLLDDLQAKNLDAAGLPLEFRKDEATFNEGLRKLPVTADILQRAGIWRVCFLRHEEALSLARSQVAVFLQQSEPRGCGDE